MFGVLTVLSACGNGGVKEESDKNSGAHTIDHARGSTEVQARPERIVTLEPLELDTAVALGVTPVGTAVASNIAGVPDYLGAPAVKPVGTVPEPDLEAIAALEPDLILGTESRHSKLYDELESVAPTVFIASQADPWKDNAELIGDALGRKAETEKLLEGVEQRCAEINEAHDVAGKTVQMIRPRDETTLSLYGPTSFAGSLLECAGYSIPEQNWEDGLQADISPENAVDAEADDVFITTTDIGDESTIPKVIANNTRAFPSVTLVDTSYWVAGVGPKGALEVLDDIEEHLATTE